MYNPKTQLPVVGKAITFATLTRLDGKGTYDFLVNPSTIEAQYTATFSNQAVLKTTFNRLAYVSSNTVVDIPEVKFYTKSNNRDLTKVLEGLKAMTRPVSEGYSLPVCRFVWGSEVYNRCYLSELRITHTQRKGDRPTEAYGSMTLLVEEEGKALAVPVNDTYVSLSTRIQSAIKDNVTKLIKGTPGVLDRLSANLKADYGAIIKQLDKMAKESSDRRFLHINVKPDGSGEAIAGSIDAKGKQTTDKRLTLPKALLEALDPKSYKTTIEKPVSTPID